jgi:hypothetical protein
MSSNLTRIKKLYRNPYIGQIGREAFVRKAKRLLPDIPTKEIRNVVDRLREYRLHKQLKRKKKNILSTRRWMSPAAFFMLHADLAFFDNFKQSNDGYIGLLAVVDVFSKKIWCRPIKNKKSKTVAMAFEAILKKMAPAIPTIVATDDGGEWAGKDFSNLMNKYSIKHYVIRGTNAKASVAEVSIKFLKNVIYRYMTALNSTRYIDFLDKIVQNLNSTYRRTIKMSPDDVNKTNESEVFETLYGKYLKAAKKYKREQLNKTPHFKKGSRVRLKVVTFKKRGYTKNYTDQIFTIAKVQPTVPLTYVLLDEDSKSELVGSFYEDEILNVDRELK